MILAVSRMDGRGHINTARRERLSMKTKVMQYQLQKDYPKTEYFIYKSEWVNECIAPHLKEGQPLAS